MDSDNLLGEFLRARRELLKPAELGLRDFGRRRVPGLRREEVALLVGVSTDYYVRLEQGRGRHPSAQVVDAVAHALRLDDEGVAHLHRLVNPAPRRRRPSVKVEQVSPSLLRLLDSWPDTPAYVIGPTLDILASNHLATALYTGFARPDNLVRMLFLDPVSAEFYLDWDRVAQGCVAALRVATGVDPNALRLIELVGELSLRSEAFRAMWARHDVRGKTTEAKNFHHPQVGKLHLRYEAFTINSAPGQ